MGNALLELLAVATATGAWMQWPGGKGVFSVDATNFNGATIALEYKSPLGNAIVAGVGTTFTAADGGVFELPPCQIRAAVSVAVPVGVTAHASKVS